MKNMHSWRWGAIGGSSRGFMWIRTTFLLELARFCFGSIGLGLVIPGAVFAQARPVLILPVSIGDDSAASVASRTQTIVYSFPTDTHEALSLEDTRLRFEEIGSSDPPTVSDTDIDTWLRLSREAVRYLARTDYAAARETLLRAQRLSEGAAEELNRELTRAQQVLDTCLYDVRGYLEQGDPRAQSRALECRRLVPRITPSPYNHTPEVIELLARIDRHLSESAPGNLRIESEPSGCAVRLNGVEFGTTPFVSEELAPGEYRAQVECEPGRRGRVHRIRLGEGTSTVRVDTRFDRAVHTDVVLRLAYPDAETADRHRLADAAQIGRIVGAPEVWMVIQDGDLIRMDRVVLTPLAVAASAKVEFGPSLVRGLRSLMAGESVDYTGGERRAMTRWQPPGLHDGSETEGETTSDMDHTVPLAIGGTIGALGVVGLAASFGLNEWRFEAAQQLSLSDREDLDYLQRQSVWLERRNVIWGVAITSGVLASASLPLLLPEEADVPWWSWLFGVAGLGVATVGAVEIGTVEACTLRGRPGDPCPYATEPIDRGVIFLSISAPLLTVPVVYLIRSAMGPSANVSVGVEANRERVIFSAGGSF